MLIKLKNKNIEFTVDTFGAQMMSIIKNGTEYLWQGNPKYWADRAPTLFPSIGRLPFDSYKYMGKTYNMNLHGFAWNSEFEVKEKGEDYVILTLNSNPQTLTVYPFEFEFNVIYRLVENTVEITYKVDNKSDKTMPFAVGGHPGFNVPLESYEDFTDYYLEFSTECIPDKFLFSEKILLNGRDTLFPLEENKRISLTHDLFDDDSITLKNMARKVTLRSKKSSHSVCLEFPQMPYFSIWHEPKTDAPYVCLEPWSSLLSRHDIIEEFSCRSDLIHLTKNNTYKNTWTITIE